MGGYVSDTEWNKFIQECVIFDDINQQVYVGGDVYTLTEWEGWKYELFRGHRGQDVSTDSYINHYLGMGNSDFESYF